MTREFVARVFPPPARIMRVLWSAAACRRFDPSELAPAAAGSKLPALKAKAIHAQGRSAYGGLSHSIDGFAKLAAHNPGPRKETLVDMQNSG
jgi:hypothetical protein